MDTPDLAPFMDVPLEIEVLIEGPRLCVRDLLALKVGSVVETERPAGENVAVLAGNSPLGVGELTASHGFVVVRMLSFRGDE